MSALIVIFVSDILPIFLIAGIGFLLARRLGASASTLSHIVFYALSPCLVFNLLVTSTVSGPDVGRMAALALFIPAVKGLIARLLAIPLNLTRPELTAFLLVVIFSNSGNLGLPMVLFAFGTEALSYATVYFVTSAMLTHTLGVFLAAFGRQGAYPALQGIVKIPTVYAVIAAVIVVATGVSIPAALMRPIGLLGDAAIPMMILVLGMQLERSKAAVHPSLVAVAVGLSLIVAPFLAFGLTSLFGVSEAARQAGILLSAMPTAVITTILAVEFDVAPQFVTSTVFISTFLSPLTLTPLIWYLQ